MNAKKIQLIQKTNADVNAGFKIRILVANKTGAMQITNDKILLKIVSPIIYVY